METITPTEEQIKAAEKLRTGKILVVYRDWTAIRMETEYGDDPYVWRDNSWRPMRMNIEDQ